MFDVPDCFYREMCRSALVQIVEPRFEMNNYYGEYFMLYAVFSIYDSGISTWLPPIYARNKGDMLRQFSDAVNNPQSTLFKHPADYTLFEVGTWDDDKCSFVLLKTPVPLGKAIEFVKAPAGGVGGAGGLVPPERSEATGALPVGSK